MKLLFDANISFRIVKKIQFAFPDCLHVSRTGLTYPAKDPEIWTFARQNNYVIVTYDEDFYDFLSIYGAPPKVIWLRFGNAPTEIVAQKLLFHKADIEGLIADSGTELLEIY
jgi:predicted nuclease of predicted toxin-antitoxin system